MLLSTLDDPARRTGPIARSLGYGVIGGVLPAGCVGGAYLFAESRAVAPGGSMDLLLFAHLAVFPAFIAVPAAVVAAGAMCFRRPRRWAAPVLAASLAWNAVLLLVPRWGWNIRREAFAALAERSRPLIDAIGAFERAEGRPPASLDELVPLYLSEVPTTGMGAYPRYIYRGSSAANPQAEGNQPDSARLEQRGPRQENRWSLSVSCPSGMLNFDTFSHWPLNNYPDTFDGSRLERIGDWAYGHE